MVDDKTVSGPRVIALGSGKGGVGKSLLSANVAIFLSTLGKRVALVDCAFGSANLHTFVGVSDPPRSLAEAWGDEETSLRDVAQATAVPGLSLVSGRDDPAWAANPSVETLARLQEQLRQLDVDFVLLDLAAGTAASTLDLFSLADTSIVVVTPDPPAVELGYRLLRAAFVRRVGKMEPTIGLAGLGTRFAGGIPSPLELYRQAVEEKDEEAADSIKKNVLAMRPQLLVNQVRSKSDMDMGKAMASAVRRVFGFSMRFLGHLEYDDAVWVSLRRGRPLLLEHPESRVAKCIEKVTRGLLAPGSEPVVTELSSGETYYDLFDVEPTATEEEIRRANRRASAVLRPRLHTGVWPVYSGSGRGDAEAARPRVRHLDGSVEAERVRSHLIPRRCAECGPRRGCRGRARCGLCQASRGTAADAGNRAGHGDDWPAYAEGARGPGIRFARDLGTDRKLG